MAPITQLLTKPLRTPLPNRTRGTANWWAPDGTTRSTHRGKDVTGLSYLLAEGHPFHPVRDGPDACCISCVGLGRDPGPRKWRRQAARAVRAGPDLSGLSRRQGNDHE